MISIININMVPVIKLSYFCSKLTYFLLSEVGAGALQSILLHYLFTLGKALLLIRTVGLDKGSGDLFLPVCFLVFVSSRWKSYVNCASSLTAATAGPSHSQIHFAVSPTFSNQLHCSPLCASQHQPSNAFSLDFCISAVWGPLSTF